MLATLVGAAQTFTSLTFIGGKALAKTRCVVTHASVGALHHAVSRIVRSRDIHKGLSARAGAQRAVGTSKHGQICTYSIVFTEVTRALVVRTTGTLGIASVGAVSIHGDREQCEAREKDLAKHCSAVDSDLRFLVLFEK